jgi:predicted aspartyl protease
MQLRRAADAGVGTADAIDARALLISVAQMNGDYREALNEILALRPLVPDASGLDNGAAFFGALAAFPRQTVSTRRTAIVGSTIRDGNLFIPVAVNGGSAQYIVDTGANFSTMAEAEARRLGLAIRDAPGSHGTDAAGTNVPFRLAVAERLSVGGFTLQHVVFLVARDDQQPFVDLPSGWRGVLGLPALLAFQTFRWHGDGRFELGFAARPAARQRANLCFDGANAVLNVAYRGRRMSAFLDTGATRTRFMAPFARDFPDSIAGQKSARATIRGVGGTSRVAAVSLQHVTLRVDGHDLVVPSADALLDDMKDRSDRYHVWAGMDLFAAARNVTVDFGSMRLSVD